MTEFNRENVRKALVELVAEKGEGYVYPPAKTGENCRYADEGQPSCLVGHVVARLDAEKFEELASWEVLEGGGGWTVAASDLDLGHDDGALTRALDEAQAVQDVGGTWGQAIQRFNDVLGAGDD